MKLFNYNSYIHIPISILFYLLSLLFPAIYYLDVNQQIGYYHSLACLLLGWMGIAIGYDVSWLANIFYLIATIIFQDKDLSTFCGLCAIIFSLSFLFQEKIIDPFEWSLVPITAYGLGYYLWLASFFVLLLGQTWLSVCRFKTNPQNKR